MANEFWSPDKGGIILVIAAPQICVNLYKYIYKINSLNITCISLFIIKYGGGGDIQGGNILGGMSGGRGGGVTGGNCPGRVYGNV